MTFIMPKMSVSPAASRNSMMPNCTPFKSCSSASVIAGNTSCGYIPSRLWAGHRPATPLCSNAICSVKGTAIGKDFSKRPLEWRRRLYAAVGRVRISARPSTSDAVVASGCSILMRQVAFNHVEHLPDRLFPHQVALHGACRHILDHVLNRLFGADIDVLVRGPG